MDEEVSIHMQDQSYRSAFSYERSSEDFSDWKQTLESLADDARICVELFEQLGLSEDERPSISIEGAHSAFKNR